MKKKSKNKIIFNNNTNNKKKKAWVAVTKKECKKMENEKEKEKEIKIEEKQHSVLMEEIEKKKKKLHPSLPSNYVTLAQLQERWIKNQQQRNEEKKSEVHQPLENRHVEVEVVANPTNVTVSRSKIFELNRREIGVVDYEGKRKSVIGDGIGENQINLEKRDVVVLAPTNVTVSRCNFSERNRSGNRDDSAKNRREIGVVSEEKWKSVIGDGIGENQINQKKQEEKNEEKSENHQLLEKRDVAVVVSTNVTVSRSNFSERNRRGNRYDSRRNRNAIGVVYEEKRKSVTGDGIGENLINQKQQEEKNEDHQSQEKRYVAVVPSANVTVSRSNSTDQNHRENRDDSTNNRRVIDVASEDRKKSETGAEIGDGNGDLDGNVEESKKKKKKLNNRGWKRREIKRKSKMEEKKAIEEGSSAENVNEEVAEKITMKIESNSKTIQEVEEKIRVLCVESDNGKQNRKIKKFNNDFRQSQSRSTRNNREGGRGRDCGHGNEDSKAQMIWVKKE